ncbi:MAG: deoxyribodipyrimidine photo-lyase [Ilumatobacter sp.]|uniref:deoxyribodipyrimidine photo-lyase n=1 Tax=Ilumatobacter sp. TaxID=1967498 RepID=UPI003297773C
MATSQIEPERCRALNEATPNADGRYVLYWMQASMRAEHNPALERAIQIANDHRAPLVVACTVVTDYPEASPRHFAFMLAGMGQALQAIERRGAGVVVRSGDDPARSIVDLAAEAIEVVLDRGYLRHQRRWRSAVADAAPCAVTYVEGDVVVPIDEASDKQETAARTLRPKIEKRRDDYIVELATTALDDTSGVRLDTDVELGEFDDIGALLVTLGLDADDAPQPVDWITPGTAAAKALFAEFVERIDDYPDDRNRYTLDRTSMMSPYLHFGQISPVWLAHRIREAGGDGAGEYLEELIVRRELACNYVEHCADHDSFAGLPGWARTSLEAHEDDERESVYTAAELENGRTGDEVWNAIMEEIRERGWVHNQLRMYWGKQIVRWTNTPRHAYRTLLDLNNRWFLDGRDPSSYANVAWCFGLHDQGFQERDVSGKLRPFTTAALKRKDDLSGWIHDREPTDDRGASGRPASAGECGAGAVGG